MNPFQTSNELQANIIFATIDIIGVNPFMFLPNAALEIIFMQPLINFLLGQERCIERNQT